MAKTSKQIISAGFHRPVCVKCCCELRPETNGVGVLDKFDSGEPCELWDADKWKCPGCGMEVIGGFANGAISAHYEADFKATIERYKSKGLLIENKEGVKS